MACFYPKDDVQSNQKVISKRLKANFPNVTQYVKNYRITNAALYEIVAIKRVSNNWELAVCSFLRKYPHFIDQLLYGHIGTFINGNSLCYEV